MVEEGRLLPGCFQEDHLQIGMRNLQNQTGEAGAGSDIDPALPFCRTQQGERGQRIQKVFDDDLPVAPESGEIDRPVPTDQLGEVEQEEIGLLRREGDPKLCGAADKKRSLLLIQGRLSIAFGVTCPSPSCGSDTPSASFRLRRSSASIRIETAAGVTPEIREA